MLSTKTTSQFYIKYIKYSLLFHNAIFVDVSVICEINIYLLTYTKFRNQQPTAMAMATLRRKHSHQPIADKRSVRFPAQNRAVFYSLPVFGKGKNLVPVGMSQTSESGAGFQC